MAWVIFDKTDLSIKGMSGATKDMFAENDPRRQWASDYNPTVEEFATARGLDASNLMKIVHNNFDIIKYGCIVVENNGTYTLQAKPAPEPVQPTPVEVSPRRTVELTTDAPDMNPVNGRFEIKADGSSSATINIQLKVESDGQLVNDTDFVEPFYSVVDKEIGTGDGSTTIFNLGITNVIEGTLVVKLDGVEVSDFTADLAVGTITFNAAPANGSVITASFSAKHKVAYITTTGGVLSTREVVLDENGAGSFTLTSTNETKIVDVTVTVQGYENATIPMEFIP